MESERTKIIYLVITPGMGGKETIDCSNIILDMYKKFSNNHKFSFLEMLDYPQLTPETAYSITGEITEELYQFLLSESGVHRFVRISPFDEKKRRHTSYVKVFFSKEPTSINTVKEMKDLELKRSYTHHPYILCKDHKTEKETEKLEDVLSGDLDVFIDS